MTTTLLDDFRCASCGGTTQRSTTTHSVDLKHGVLVIRNVPVAVCTRCGDEWLDNDTARELETLAQDAKKRKAQIEVLSYDEVTRETVATA